MAEEEEEEKREKKEIFSRQYNKKYKIYIYLLHFN